MASSSSSSSSTPSSSSTSVPSNTAAGTAGVVFSNPADYATRIQMVGNVVTDDVVLNYFATSPFFDSNSINQVLIEQGIDRDITNIMKTKTMDGIMFVIDHEISRPPRLFAINKIDRAGMVLLEMYFCFDGAIMRAPQLVDLIQTRFGKAAMHLQRSFELMFPCEERTIDLPLAIHEDPNKLLNDNSTLSKC
jgi:hypothetical protein